MSFELYDILTLENNIDYCIVKMLQEEDNQFYFLLAEMKEDEPTDIYTIVHYVKDGNMEYVESVEDETLLRQLKEQFVQLLGEEE